MRRDFLKGLIGLLAFPFAWFVPKPAVAVVTAGIDVQKDRYVVSESLHCEAENKTLVCLSGETIDFVTFAQVVTLHLSDGTSEKYRIRSPNKSEFFDLVKARRDYGRARAILGRMVDSAPHCS